MKHILIILCLISSCALYSDNENGTETETKKPRKTVSMSRVVASSIWQGLKLHASTNLALDYWAATTTYTYDINRGTMEPNYSALMKYFIAASIAAQSLYEIKKLADECAGADQTA